MRKGAYINPGHGEVPNASSKNDARINEFLARKKKMVDALESPRNPPLPVIHNQHQPIRADDREVYSNSASTSTDFSIHRPPRKLQEANKEPFLSPKHSNEQCGQSSSNEDSGSNEHITVIRSHVQPKKVFKINEIDEKCITNSEIQYRVLVHSRHKYPEPITRVADANFTDSVHKAMHSMYFRSPYRMQTISWRHILRGNSMVLINNAACHKTMSFLPAICSLVQLECVDQVVRVAAGPIAVILCVSSVKVVEVAGLCRKFLNYHRADDNTYVVHDFGERNVDRTVPLLINGCGILVCTVPNLLRLLNIEIEMNHKLFDKQRIKHFVIDDIDLIVKRFSTELNSVTKSLCPHASNGETEVQIIVTARIWRPQWHSYLKLGMNPILCIGAFIEAAVYGRSEIQLKLISSAQKIDHVIIALLRQRKYMENRTIVVCSKSEEVLELIPRLRDLSISAACCHSKSSITEISAAKRWNLEAPPGQNTVLVCTDEHLIDLDIRSAQNVIHYSLPSDWTQFSLRFSAISDCLDNFVLNDKPTRAFPYSLVMLDENNNQQLPRLIDFMLEHDVSGISEEILQLAHRIRRGIEDKRRVEFVPFCPNILLLGVCNNISCRFRHSLIYADRSKDHLPRNGRIKMEILDCHSPSHYSVRIIEHMSPGAIKWQPVSREYLVFSMKLQNYYAVAENHRAHIPVRVGDLCVLPPQSDFDTSYHRCQIMRVDTKHKKVSVKLVDVGISLQAICCDDLLELADEFADFPSQAVDVRIANLIPYDYDAEWDAVSLGKVKSWLQEYCKENTYIDGSIQWSSCLNTIWIDTLRVNEKLATSMDVFVMSVRRKLLKEKFGIEDDRCLKKLQQMAANCGIHETPAVKVEAIKPSQLEPKIENTPTIDRNRGRRLPSKPFPTPKSRKSSSGPDQERWLKMQLNIFQSVTISTFNTPWKFYVQIRLPELYELYDSIDKFTATENKQLLISENLTIGMMCLGKAYEVYNRAKVMAIECNPDRGIMVTVFFVDLGQYSVLPLNDLFAIPEYLIEIQPFQAILCSLVGIRPTNNHSDWNLEICSRIYDEILQGCANMAIRPVNGRNGPKSELDICSYDCVLVDMDNDDKKSTLNDRIVSSGFACYDTNDRHHLTVNGYPDVVDAKPLDSDDDSDTSENWDNDNYQRPQNSDLAAQFPSFNSDEDGEKIFDYNFTDDEVMKALRSLLNLPSNVDEVFGLNTADTSEKEITDITDNKSELDSVNESVTEPKEPEVREITDPEELYYQNIKIPALKRPAAVPNVKWHQSNEVILLVIEAPDICDYYLHVTSRSLQYSCIVGSVPQMLHMNLFGCIDTEYTSHELRGLKVNVRLMKTLRGPHIMWPRLLASDDRHQWLKYNTEAISLDETPMNQFKKSSNNMLSSPQSDDDSDSQPGSDVRIDYDKADPLSTEFD